MLRQCGHMIESLAGEIQTAFDNQLLTDEAILRDCTFNWMMIRCYIGLIKDADYQQARAFPDELFFMLCQMVHLKGLPYITQYLDSHLRIYPDLLQQVKEGLTHFANQTQPEKFSIHYIKAPQYYTEFDLVAYMIFEAKKLAAWVERYHAEPSNPPLKGAICLSLMQLGELQEKVTHKVVKLRGRSRIHETRIGSLQFFKDFLEDSHKSLYDQMQTILRLRDTITHLHGVSDTDKKKILNPLQLKDFLMQQFEKTGLLKPGFFAAFADELSQAWHASLQNLPKQDKTTAAAGADEETTEEATPVSVVDEVKQDLAEQHCAQLTAALAKVKIRPEGLIFDDKGNLDLSQQVQLTLFMLENARIEHSVWDMFSFECFMMCYGHILFSDKLKKSNVSALRSDIIVQLAPYLAQRFGEAKYKKEMKDVFIHALRQLNAGTLENENYIDSVEAKLFIDIILSILRTNPAVINDFLYTVIPNLPQPWAAFVLIFTPQIVEKSCLLLELLAFKELDVDRPLIDTHSFRVFPLHFALNTGISGEAIRALIMRVKNLVVPLVESGEKIEHPLQLATVTYCFGLGISHRAPEITERTFKALKTSRRFPPLSALVNYCEAAGIGCLDTVISSGDAKTKVQRVRGHALTVDPSSGRVEKASRFDRRVFVDDRVTILEALMRTAPYSYSRADGSHLPYSPVERRSFLEKIAWICSQRDNQYLVNFAEQCFIKRHHQFSSSHSSLFVFAAELVARGLPLPGVGQTYVTEVQLALRAHYANKYADDTATDLMAEEIFDDLASCEKEMVALQTRLQHLDPDAGEGKEAGEMVIDFKIQQYASQLMQGVIARRGLVNPHVEEVSVAPLTATMQAVDLPARPSAVGLFKLNACKVLTASLTVAATVAAYCYRSS